MKKIFTGMCISLFLAGCVTNESHRTNSALNNSSSPSNAVTILNNIPYKKGAMIATNIKLECLINSQLSEFIYSYGSQNNIEIKRVSDITNKTQGQYLIVEIVNAVSAGNAFIGHRKYTKIKGVLHKSGKRVAGFTAARYSGGGLFAGFKGSCSVLGRTVKTLGKDVAGWLVNPVDGVHLGDGI